MEHLFREGDLVIAVAEEDQYGMTEGMERALRNCTPFQVANVRGSCVATKLNGSIVNWHAKNLRYASAEEQEKFERAAAEKRRKEEEQMAMPPEKLIEEAKKHLRESPSALGSSNGVAVHVKHGCPLKVSTGPCHGFIRNEGRQTSVAIVTLLVRGGEGGYAGHQCGKEVLIAYYDWLLSRSPYSSCFYGRSGKKAVEEKVTALRTDVPANLLQGALISTRNTWEFPHAINLWYDLVRKGVGENAAFVACHFASRSGDQVRLSPVERDHIAISTNCMSAQGLKAFIKGTPLFETRDYNQRGDYRGVQKAFNGKGAPISITLRSEFEKYGQVSSVIRNPFAKAKLSSSDTQEMSTEKYASFVKDIFPKLIK